MATIIKRKSKYSVVYYYTDEKGEKHQKWETCQDYNEAKRRKAEIESQLFNGTFIPPQELLILFLYMAEHTGHFLHSKQMLQLFQTI